MLRSSLAFPKTSSALYSALLRNIIQKQELKKVANASHSAEHLIAKSFCRELHKLAFSGAYLMGTARDALVSQGISEGMNRALNGNEAGRTPGQIATDAAKQTALHMPFASLAHFGLPKLHEWIASKPAGSLANYAGNAASLAVRGANQLTNPYVKPGLQVGVHLLGHLGGKLF